MKYTVFPWCTSITLHKIFGKITQVIKSTQHGNFRNTFPGGTQKLTADFQPVCIQGRPVIAMLDSQNAVILVGYSDTNVVYEDLNDSTRHSVKYEEMDQMTSGSGNTYIG